MIASERRILSKAKNRKSIENSVNLILTCNGVMVNYLWQGRRPTPIIKWFTNHTELEPLDITNGDILSVHEECEEYKTQCSIILVSTEVRFAREAKITDFLSFVNFKFV